MLRTDPKPESSPPATGPAIDLDGVGMQFATASGIVHALGGVSFSVQPREFVSLVGP